MKGRHSLAVASVVALAAARLLFWLGFERPDGQLWLQLGVHIYIGFFAVMALAALGVLGLGVALVLQLIHLFERTR